MTESDVVAAISGHIVDQPHNIVNLENIMTKAGGPYFHDAIGADRETLFDAAWELCRRGILRPMETTGYADNYMNRQMLDYAATRRGVEWASSRAEDYRFFPFEVRRATALLSGFRAHFGDAYAERSTEAVRCYDANLFLACCAMCGAAAESVLLSVAFQKVGDEKKVLQDYQSAGGRKKIENQILPCRKQDVRDRIHAYLDVLNYWRDGAAHGAAVGITEPEAEAALEKLYGLSHFVSSRWEELTT